MHVAGYKHVIKIHGVNLWTRHLILCLEFGGSNMHLWWKGEIYRYQRDNRNGDVLLCQTDSEMQKCRIQKGFDTLVVYTLTYEC